MKYVEKLEQTGGCMEIDGTFFRDCRFTDCVLMYSGGPYGWRNTVWTNCTFVFEGAALNTQNFLKEFGWGPQQQSIVMPQEKVRLT